MRRRPWILGAGLACVLAAGCSGGTVFPETLIHSYRKTAEPSEAEMQLFRMLNAERRKHDLRPLRMSPVLNYLAREHARDMAAMQCLSHVGSDDLTVEGRVTRAGVDWQMVGENVARNRGYDAPEEKAVGDWMQSPGHRHNILNAAFTRTGLGVAVGEDGYFYYTQVFVQPMPE